MSFDYINEAFRKLNMLNEDVFDTSVGGLNNLSNFMDNDDDNIVKVIDPEAETDENLSTSYVGKVIIDCNVCHSKIFSEKTDVVLSEDGVVNPEEQCPYCGETSGFTVVGEIKEFEQEPESTKAATTETSTEGEMSDTSSTSDEVDNEKPVDESLETGSKSKSSDELEEGIFDSLRRKSSKNTESGYNVPSNARSALLRGAYYIIVRRDDAGGSTVVDFDNRVFTYNNKNRAEEIARSLARSAGGRWEVADAVDVKMYLPRNFDFEANLQEGIFDFGKKKRLAAEKARQEQQAKKDAERKRQAEAERERGEQIARDWKEREARERQAKKDYERKRYNNISGSSPSNTGYRGVNYSGGDYYESLNEEFDAFTAVSAFLANKGYNVSSKEGKAYVWGVVDYLDLGNIEPTRDNLETWLSNTLSFDEYKAELEAACGMNEAVESDNLDEAYFKPVDGEPGVKRALIDSCDEFTVTLLEITDEDGTWYEVGINHPTKDFEQVEIGEYRTAEFAESIAQKVVSMLNKYVELEELTSIYEFGTRSIYDKVASRMPETEPTTEELNEDIQNLSLTTDETQVKLTSDENGKVTLVTEPVIKEEAEPEVVEEEPAVDGELEIAPVSDETVDAIVDNNDVETEEEEPVEEEELPAEEPVEGEEDVALDEVDEEGLDELGESYMKSVYENVESFKTTSVSANDTHIVVEGLIKFNSGVERKTGFIFEAYTSNDNKVSFVGCNEHFSKKGNSFTLNCSVADKKLLPESLSYNYDVNGKTISGTVRRKGV